MRTTLDGKTNTNCCWFLCVHFIVLLLSALNPQPWILNHAILNVCASPSLAGQRYSTEVMLNLYLMQSLSKCCIVDKHRSETDYVLHEGVFFHAMTKFVVVKTKKKKEKKMNSVLTLHLIKEIDYKRKGLKMDL